MPSDWLFYWMTLPSGLAVIGAAIAIPFLIWRLVLGDAFKVIGFKPLAAAYVCLIIGLLALALLSSYIEFSDRVAKGILPEAQRWSTVFGWGIYLAVLSLIVVLPIAGVIGVPVTALLLKLRRYTYLNIALVAVGLLLLLVAITWSFPGNEWARTHRLQSFVITLKDYSLGVAFVGLPFLLSIRWVSRLKSNEYT